MKNIKRLITVLLAVTILVNAHVVATAASTPKVFSDVKEGSWYKQYVDEISTKGIIEGYGNGKFGPNDTLKVVELLTMMVKANNLTVSKDKNDTFWGSPYIRKAFDQGWVKDEEFLDYKVAITRGEIARIIARALPKFDTPISISEYKNMFKDYGDIDPTYREDICKVRAAGIIEGYYDAKYEQDNNDDPYNGMVFGASKTATRAEASTMLVKYLNPTKRTTPSVVIGNSKAYYNGFVTGIEGFNTSLIAIDGVSNSENDGYNRYLVSFDVVIWKDFKAQPELAAQGYQEAKEILLQKIDEATVDAAIAYAKTKTDPEMKLDTKWFTSTDEKYKIAVESFLTEQTDIDFSVYNNK